MQRVFPQLATGVPWGLERPLGALSDLGDPHLRFPTLHVGGTNGKGSVAATVAAVLAAAGHRVGLYTSPHLIHFRERFQVAGQPLADDVIAGYGAEVRDVVCTWGLTFFEAATVLGLHAFSQEDVDVAVVEVGLGGRLDATNVVRPLCSVITNVALDHADYLGSTLASVSFEKAGIIKRGVPLLTAEADDGVLELLGRIAAERSAPMVALGPRQVTDVLVTPGRTSFELRSGSWGKLRLSTPLVGAHQALNAALAVEAVGYLPEGLRPGVLAVRNGVRTVRWPGRAQVEAAPEGTWLFDVAHNAAGVLSLVDTLGRLALPRPLGALLGVLGDKDWRTMLPPLLSHLDFAVLTQPPSAPAERRWDPEEAREVLRGSSAEPRCPLDVQLDFGIALGAARRLAGAGTVVVTGSVHTVGSAFHVLGRDAFGPL